MQQYENRHHSNYRLDRLDEGGFDELGILPSTTDQWMKAQDAEIPIVQTCGKKVVKVNSS